MNRDDDSLEVWLDDDLGAACQVGTLAHDRGQIRFRYERQWLNNPRAFALDPDLSLDEHPFFPKPELGNFGIFLDSSPDCWGQTLIKRREALLVAPSASLGGARSKANFTQEDGTLWIGKFPARDDDRDKDVWEYVVHQLARQAGVDVPPAKLVKLNSGFHTFCVQRFDRAGAARRFYASAMTLLRKTHSEGTSYLELAQFIRAQGDAGYADKDLAQLFRRVAFNVAAGNRDDHLRNHGFILGKTGWRLAPAFDVSPDVDKGEHLLNIDDVDNRPDLDTVLSTAMFYGLNDGQARQIVREVMAVVDGWREMAQRLRVARAEVEWMAGAFSAHEQGKL